MNVLFLNGSPHGGDSAGLALAEYAARDLPGERVRLDLYDLAIRPCRGCNACRADGCCVLDADDDMGEVVRRLVWSDVVLMASPLHFTSLSGPLVSAIGRLQRYWGSDGLGGKPRVGGLAVTGGARYPDMFEPARRVAAATFVTLGVRFAGMATAAETDRVPVRENPDALAEAARLGQAVTSFFTDRTL